MDTNYGVRGAFGENKKLMKKVKRIKEILKDKIKYSMYFFVVSTIIEDGKNGVVFFGNRKI